jgi:photosystem II stability/assembly factor-like uncharacterized protein
MAGDYTICVGTIGAAVWQSPDGGESWKRIHHPFPLPMENDIRALAVDPNNPKRLLAGSDTGLYSSEDRGETWQKIDSPMDDKDIWSAAIHPDDPNIIYAGTHPPNLFRTKDRGKTWERLPIDVQPSPAGLGKGTVVLFDPRDHRTIYAGFEWGGIYRSVDNGNNWTLLPDCGPDPIHTDIHGIAISVGQPSKILVTTPTGLHTSTDEGESWEMHSFPLFHEDDMFSYCRDISVKEDDHNVLFVGNGDTIPGDIGSIQRSKDRGNTWESLPMPVEPNSHFYHIATHPSNPNRLVAIACAGEVYTSENAGDSWQKVNKEFGEVRAVAWVPNN